MEGWVLSCHDLIVLLFSTEMMLCLAFSKVLKFEFKVGVVGERIGVGGQW